jgi:hypothetical protein
MVLTAELGDGAGPAGHHVFNYLVKFGMLTIHRPPMSRGGPERRRGVELGARPGPA